MTDKAEAPTELLRSGGNITMTNGGVKDPKGLIGVGHFIVTKNGKVVRKPAVPEFKK